MCHSNCPIKNSENATGYFSSDCDRFSNTTMYLYKKRYFFTGEYFVHLKEVISIVYNTEKDELSIAYDNGDYLKLLTLVYKCEQHHVMDLYHWLCEKLELPTGSRAQDAPGT
jgi:hypothetical protein